MKWSSHIRNLQQMGRAQLKNKQTETYVSKIMYISKKSYVPYINRSPWSYKFTIVVLDSTHWRQIDGLEQERRNSINSIGRVFDPLCDGGARWRPFRFRSPSWVTSFSVPGMRLSKMAAGSERAAILRHRHNGGRKTRPRSWLTSFSAPPSWNQDGGATSNVWRTSGFPRRRLILRKGSSQSKNILKTFEVIFFLLFEKHLIVSLPHPFSKWLRELPACHYGEVDQSARVNTTLHGTWCWLQQAPTLLIFWGDFMFLFIFNCTLQ